MIYAVTPTSMRKLEQDHMRETGTPSLDLMERAAQALVSHLRGHVLFLCGFGQNGGDGYAAAMLYTGKKTVWQFFPEKLTGDAKTNAAILQDAAIIQIEDSLPPIPSDVEFIVDALFGTGLCRPIEGIVAQAIAKANESEIKMIACDIPSGINGETGAVMGCAIKAYATVTFHQPKAGLYLNGGLDHSGMIHIADIGIPSIQEDFSILEPADLPMLRPKRLRNTHKGDYGRVLIIAGKMGMAGAAAICAAAAIGTGAGLTTIACDEDIMPILQTLVPCAMCVPLKDAQPAIEKADAIAIGPGLGTTDDRLPIMKAVIQAQKPTVWDADALNLLAKHRLLRPQGAQNIFTPHPGEAARFGHADLQAHLGGTVVLKGAASTIDSGTQKAINMIGTPAMAKGGSGDALTGIIAALFAKNPENPFLAAQLGCLLHGMAGCAAANEAGENGLDAFKLINKIP